MPKTTITVHGRVLEVFFTMDEFILFLNEYEKIQGQWVRKEKKTKQRQPMEGIPYTYPDVSDDNENENENNIKAYFYSRLKQASVEALEAFVLLRRAGQREIRLTPLQIQAARYVAYKLLRYTNIQNIWVSVKGSHNKYTYRAGDLLLQDYTYTPEGPLNPKIDETNETFTYYVRYWYNNELTWFAVPSETAGLHAAALLAFDNKASDIQVVTGWQP